MTNEQINKVIAEFLGWTHIDEYAGTLYGWPPNEIQPRYILPITNYCHDLNACQDAFNAMPDNVQVAIERELCLAADCPLWADAPTRAKAIVKGLGKWKD